VELGLVVATEPTQGAVESRVPDVVSCLSWNVTDSEL
jgi:hypothetical protein